ncbi:MAG: hypothetical protein JXQ76_11185 [Campylobacterales bacterium]|nr:hypothetical protein [Campylobacterales bacterium]
MIVSDSTTLIILLDLDRVELLSNLFESITIPQAVFDELNHKGSITLPNFINVVQVEPSETLEMLKKLLDSGESEAIALALQRKEKLIIDEKKGRKIALNQGIEIIGLLGIIYLNIKKGFMTQNEAKSFIDDALKNGYRISNRLIEGMLNQLKKL